MLLITVQINHSQDIYTIIISGYQDFIYSRVTPINPCFAVLNITIIATTTPNNPQTSFPQDKTKNANHPPRRNRPHRQPSPKRSPRPQPQRDSPGAVPAGPRKMYPGRPPQQVQPDHSSGLRTEHGRRSCRPQRSRRGFLGAADPLPGSACCGCCSGRATCGSRTRTTTQGRRSWCVTARSGAGAGAAPYVLVRPTRLVEGDGEEGREAAMVFGGNGTVGVLETISRGAVARFLVDAAERGDWDWKAPIIVG